MIEGMLTWVFLPHTWDRLVNYDFDTVTPYYSFVQHGIMLFPSTLWLKLWLARVLTTIAQTYTIFDNLRYLSYDNVTYNGWQMPALFNSQASVIWAMLNQLIVPFLLPHIFFGLEPSNFAKAWLFFPHDELKLYIAFVESWHPTLN